MKTRCAAVVRSVDGSRSNALGFAKRLQKTDGQVDGRIGKTVSGVDSYNARRSPLSRWDCLPVNFSTFKHPTICGKPRKTVPFEAVHFSIDEGAGDRRCIVRAASVPLKIGDSQ